MARSPGHCMTMGTASTMACLAEALGMQLPYSATWPAVDARRDQTAQRAGQRIVELVEADVRPSSIMIREAFEDAVKVNAAIGGSTNAVIHLAAIAGRLGVPFSLDDVDALGRDVPTLVDLEPSGRFLMEDLCYAGGLPAVMQEIAGLLHLGRPTVAGGTVGDAIADAACWNREVIHPFDRPMAPAGSGTAVLRGNLAPDGAVIKQSAASPSLQRHRGRALVFESPEEYRAVSDELDIDESTVLVLRYCGPTRVPGHARGRQRRAAPQAARTRGAGHGAGVSDGRMSGTAYGTVVLHVAPEAAVGGPLALVETGDEIELDVPGRSLTLHVEDDELARRRERWRAPAPAESRGWTRLYTEHVLQADHGADLDFLVGAGGAEVPRESH